MPLKLLKVNFEIEANRNKNVRYEVDPNKHVFRPEQNKYAQETQNIAMNYISITGMASRR